MVQVSVIMPLFNAARYLPEALQSVLGQTYKDFELICINDCSTDDTGNILQEYQEQDARVKILENQEHSGAAISRNNGLKEAQGKYVIFLDGDDIFEEELLEKANEAMDTYCVDVVLFESMHVPSETIYTKKVKERSEYFIEHYCKTPFSVKDFDPMEFPNQTDSPWDKMFRRSFLDENRLEFQDLPSSNDVYFVKMALFCAKKIIWLDDRRIMVYARDHFEPSRISYDRDPMCTYLAMDKLGKELEKRGLFEQLLQHYYCVLCFRLQGALIRTKTEEKAKSFYQFLQNEGIENLTSLYKSKNLKLDNYIFNFVRKFEELGFESEWYKSVNDLYYYLERKHKNVIELIGSYHDRGIKIALWGAGINGKIFLDFLSSYHIKIEAVIDKNENKWGKEIDGYSIKQPAEAMDEIQAVITTSNSIYNALCKELDERDIEIININDILGRYL